MSESCTCIHAPEVDAGVVLHASYCPAATADRLTPQREAEIDARAEAATEGPWEEYPEYGEHFYAYLRGSYLRGVGTLNFGDGEDAEADLALTLNAREDIDDLLAELAAVRKERDEARRDAELQRADYFSEAARLLEDTGRDDDVVNLLDIVAAGIRAHADDPNDNRRRIYIDGEGEAWIDRATYADGTRYIVPVEAANAELDDAEEIRRNTGALREIGRCW